MQRFFCTVFVLIISVSLARAEENWPQFRGPGGQGISDAKNLPLNWSDTQNVKWKTPVHGKAWSSPVIWKSQIWLTAATEDGKELSVLCIDKASGKILLDNVLFHIEHPQDCPVKFNSFGSPTPIIEEGRLYATFGSPGTACLDTKDGKVLWQRTDFVCNHFRRAGSSPLIWNNLMFMNFDGSDFQFCVALDKNTGKTVWRTERSIDFQDIDKKTGKIQADGDMRKAFSTPRIMTWEGKSYLISTGSKATYCYDPETGKELWRTEFRGAHSGSVTPVIGDGLVFISTGNGGTEIWAVRPGGSGVINDTNVVWRAKKKTPTRTSPLLVNGLLYFVNESGIFTCLDAKTGEEVFSGRIEGQYSASPLYANGRIYCFNQSGKTTVLEAGRELKVIAENQLTIAREDQRDPWGIMGTPAVSGNALFIRTRTDLFRVEDSAVSAK
jgi:outer membrane protein assembly factor BamB